MPIRNSAKAIIIRQNQLLLTKNEDREGVYYLFPGGGQEHGEELCDAVKRECMEELGHQVIVGDLFHVREYIGKNHQFAEWDREIHQVEFYFRCELVDPDAAFTECTNPDQDQIGVEWIPLDALNDIRLYPGVLARILQGGEPAPRYLGDTN